METLDSGDVRTIVPRRSPSEQKYKLIYTLASHGLLAQDIVALTPQCFELNNDILMVNGKELTLEEAKEVASYLLKYKDNIETAKVLFFGKFRAKLTVDNVSIGMRHYLKTIDKSLIDIGWATVVKSKAKVHPIETIDDVSEILGLFNIE